MREKARKIWNGFLTILVAVTVLAAASLILVRLVDIYPYIVLSGSMEPVYPTGSLIYVRKTAPEDLEEGNVITFFLDQDMVVTHRIVEVKKTENPDQIWYRTKGDANKTADGRLVSSRDVIGVPVFSVPAAGYAIEAVKKSPVKEILFASAAAIILITLFLDVTNRGEAFGHPNKRKGGFS